MVEYYDNGGSVKLTQRDAERESRNRITVIVNARDSVMPAGSNYDDMMSDGSRPSRDHSFLYSFPKLNSQVTKN